MAVRYSTTMRNTVADAVRTGLASASGTFTIYTGSQPASADDAASGTLLVQMALASGTWNAASGGACTKTASTVSGTAAATGTAGWARFTLSGKSVDGTVSAAGGGGDFIIDSTSITSGVVYYLQSATITAGGA